MRIPSRWGRYIGAQNTGTQITAPVKHYYEHTYNLVNYVALAVHALNFVGVLIAYGAHNQFIKPGYAFVSPTVPLRWTNHALVLVNSTDNRCSAVARSPHFQATLRHESSYPPREAFPNFMGLFDFTGTDIIEYDMGGAEINISVMLTAFCLLSLLFQYSHQRVLMGEPYAPRYLHYLEYAFSSPLMAMIMAVEVGIVELFSVTGIGGLFFGMNIAGMCAELLLHFASVIEDPAIGTYRIEFLIFATHGAGWVMFFMAMVPIWAQFHAVLMCSENGGTPTYIYALIVVESFLFFAFGFLQVKGIFDKLKFHRSGYVAHDDGHHEKWVELLFKYDCAHALLSVVAKTILVWLLVAPMLTVDVDALVDRRLAYL